MSIQIKNLTHIYSEGMAYEAVALDDVNFQIEDGEFVGIIGHTGSGKSTLLQHLNGLLKPKTGSIIINGTDITNKNISLHEIRKKIGLVFQYPEYQLFEETIAKDVAFGPLNLGLSEEEVQERVKEAIGLVGMNYEELKDRSPFELSGGQKRRIAIAGVIAMRPEVLILDEPTAGLDPKSHKELLHMVYEIHKSQKNITILVSHNMRDIANFTDKVIVMDKGKAVLTGTPKEIFREREKLVEMGLSVPPATEILYQIREKGINIDTDALNIDEAVKSIVAALGEK